MRRRLVRIAAPAAFLLAATVAVLLVRAALRADEDDRPPATTTARTAVEELRAVNRGPEPVELRLRRPLRVP